MDPGPLSPLELEAVRAAVEVPTPPEDAPTPAPAPPVEEPASAPPAKVEPMTLEEMRKFEPTKDVVLGLEAQLADLTVQKDAMRDGRDALKVECGRARTEASNAKQLHERYQRALHEAASEFNVAGVRTTIDHLVAHPAELPSLVRRLARTVREIGPDRDALRREVARLNGEALEHPKAIAAKDATIEQLRKDVEAGKRREQLLESTAAQIQTGRDKGLDQLGTSLKEQEKLVNQLADAKLQARAKLTPKQKQDLVDRMVGRASRGYPPGTSSDHIQGFNKLIRTVAAAAIEDVLEERNAPAVAGGVKA